MKKQQRPLEWKDDDLETSTELVGVFDDLEGLGELDDEAIIDLEEVVDLTGEGRAEGDDHKGGLFDSEGVLDFGDVDMDMGGPAKMGLSDDDDFLKDLSFTDDGIPLDDGESLEVKVLDNEGTHIGEDDLDFGSLMGFSEETQMDASGQLSKMDDLGTDGGDMPDDLFGFGDAPASDDTGDAAFQGAVVDDPAVEELISLIETRLVGVVEQIVESRLTDIVRTVLREEIERMRGEMGPAGE